MGYARHPVGMTMQYPVRDQSKVNDVLFDGPADWISPGFDDVESPMHDSRHGSLKSARKRRREGHRDTGPLLAHGTTHVGLKSFLRGHNPIPTTSGSSGVNPPDPSLGNPSFASLEPARYAMGDTLRFARGDGSYRDGAPRRSQLYRLRAREPRRGVPRPTAQRDGRTVHRDVESQRLLGPVARRPRREAKGAGKVTVENPGGTTFEVPFAETGPAVLHLKGVEL